MAEINPSELVKRLKASEADRLYYIYGADVAAVEAATKAILKKKLGREWESEVTKFDGKNLDPGEFADTLEMNTLFAECNVILVNDLNCDELRQDVFDTVWNSVQSLPEQTVLVINITGFDVKNGKKVFSGRNKKLTDYISKNGVLCCCAKKTVSELSKFISAKVQKNDCTISPANAELLASLCLMDTMRIENEIAKLCSYRLNQEIRKEDIELLVPGQLETDSFKFAEAVISKNSQRSFIILNELLSKYDSPALILSAVSMSFTDLYRVKSALSAGKHTSDVVNDFAYGKRSFAVDKAFRNCRKISAENIRKCMSVLRNTDRKLKRTSDVTVINTEMEKMLTELLIAVKNG
ncbi:MAG: DNA polymerase III subunit delta [Porcipelethomonas sp.]